MRRVCSHHTKLLSADVVDEVLNLLLSAWVFIVLLLVSAKC